MRRAILLALALTTLVPALSVAQSGYVRDSVGSRKTSAAKSGPSLYNLPFDRWRGEKLVFAPKSRGLREYGYNLVEPEQPYALVGEVVTVTDVERGPDGYIIRMVTGDGALISTRLLDSPFDDISISDLAPLRDIEWARQRWLGKQVWLKPSPYRVELMTYDAETDKWDSISVKNATAVTVIDVVASNEVHAPVRMIMRTKDGDEGYVDVSVFDAPPNSLLNAGAHFDRHFFETDPRTKHQWSIKTWAAIEQQKVFVGMTREQARLSWGTPSSINKTTVAGKTREQWVFGRLGYLYFTDGILTGIHN